MQLRPTAAVSAAKEAIHLKLLLLKELEIDSDSDYIVVEEDNQACIAQVKGGLRHIRKAKHYSSALRFLQKLVVDKEIQFNYCETNKQLADIFT